jgi:nucleoside-diphosphate-sugar epimerase
MYISDVAEALAALVDSGVEGAVNIGTGNGISLRSGIEAIITKLGRADLVNFGALPIPKGQPPVLVADAHRLRDEVGISPRFSLDAGIEDTIRHWRDQDSMARCSPGNHVRQL